MLGKLRREIPIELLIGEVGIKQLA